MGNPLLGEAPARQRCATSRAVANPSSPWRTRDAMLMDSEINDPHKAWRSTNQHRASSPSALGALSFLRTTTSRPGGGRHDRGERAKQPRPPAVRRTRTCGAPSEGVGRRSRRALTAPARRPSQDRRDRLVVRHALDDAGGDHAQRRAVRRSHPPPTHESQPFYESDGRAGPSKQAKPPTHDVPAGRGVAPARLFAALRFQPGQPTASACCGGRRQPDDGCPGRLRRTAKPKQGTCS